MAGEIPPDILEQAPTNLGNAKSKYLIIQAPLA
jgi:hypothetical protein